VNEKVPTGGGVSSGQVAYFLRNDKKIRSLSKIKMLSSNNLITVKFNFN